MTARSRVDRVLPERARAHRHLLTGSAVLVVGAAVQAIGGSLFWLLAAWHFPKSQVGTASALFTSVNFVTYAAGLGLPVALARFAVGRTDEADTVFTWGAVTTVISAIAAGLLYLVFLGVVDPPSTIPLANGGALWQAGFLVSVIGSALSLIFDVRCMTLRRWHYVLARISLMSAIRLPLVLWIRPENDPALWLFVFSVAPLASTGFVGVAFINRVAGGRLRLRPRPINAAATVRYSAVNYLSTLGYQAPYFALPVIVLAHVDAGTNAAFYVAWGVISVACYVPSAIGQALLAEGGKEGAAIKSQLNTAMLVAVGIMTVAAIAAWFGSGIIETVYGTQYHDAARLLPEMMIAGIPWAISSLYLTEARVLHRNLATILITTVLTVAIVVPALILVPGAGAGHGIVGAGHAWLFGNLAGMCVAIGAHLYGDRWRSVSAADVIDAVTDGRWPSEPAVTEMADSANP